MRLETHLVPDVHVRVDLPAVVLGLVVGCVLTVSAAAGMVGCVTERISNAPCIVT